MTVFWKLRRELSRLKQQILSMPAFFFEARKQRQYDRDFEQHIQVVQGIDTDSSLYALLLCYQPDGLSASTLFTCQHLRSHGYKVLLVSNAAIAATTLVDVQAHVWRIIVRPNFGYDFGGYRDGIRLLKNWGVKLERLLIINDSIWYPLYKHDAALKEIASSHAEFHGAIQLSKHDRPTKIFYESYFYGFSGRFFNHSKFTEFWSNYKLSNIKYRAVKAGERGFSKAMLTWSVNHNPIFHREKMLLAMTEQHSEFLLNTLKYAAYIDSAFELRGHQLVSAFVDNTLWRDQALSHIRSVATRRHFHASFCYASIQLLGVPFLKKSTAPLHIAMRRQFVAAVLAGDLPMPSSVSMFEEINRRDASI